MWRRDHGLPGELPPSDDEGYYDGYSDEEQGEIKLDKFGERLFKNEWARTRRETNPTIPSIQLHTFSQ